MPCGGNACLDLEAAFLGPSEFETGYGTFDNCSSVPVRTVAISTLGQSAGAKSVTLRFHGIRLEPRVKEPRVGVRHGLIFSSRPLIVIHAGLHSLPAKPGFISPAWR